MNTRFDDAEWLTYVKRTQVTIVGLGGIGSWTAFLLSRLSPFRMITIDGDSVSLHNVGSQLYSERQAYNLKTKAMSEIISAFAPASVIRETYDIMLDQDNIGIYIIPRGLIVSATDNIASRTTLFQFLKSQRSGEVGNYGDLLFLDGRMTAEYYDVYAVDFADQESIDAYESTLFDPSESEQLPCGFQQTSHVAANIGSIMTSLFVNYASYKTSGFKFRPIPFLTRFDARMLTLTQHTANEIRRTNSTAATEELIYGYESSVE